MNDEQKHPFWFWVVSISATQNKSAYIRGIYLTLHYFQEKSVDHV